MNPFAPRDLEPKYYDLVCPVCKTTTVIRTAYHEQWRLDCLNCCRTEHVRVVITEWRRAKRLDKDKEEFGEWIDWTAMKTKMYFHLPENTNVYVWEWDFNNKKTSLNVIDRDSEKSTVHIFDELMDINLTNFITKTKMCLVFG